MYTDITGYAWQDVLLDVVSVIAVVAFVVVVATLATATGGIAGAALMAIAFSAGIGAITGANSAIQNGTSLAAGVLSGGIKGAAIGTAIGLGIMTGGGAFSGLGALAAFGTALSANFVGGMLSYTIDNVLNGRDMDFNQAARSGMFQTISGAFAFAAGGLIGLSGFYNIPGVTKMFSGPWIGNTSAGLLFKGVYYYGIDAVLNLMR